MSKILIVNTIFFKTSETFIQRQVVCLVRKFNVLLLANKFDNTKSLPVDVNERLLFPDKSRLIDRGLSFACRKFLGMSLPFGFFGSLFIRKLFKTSTIDIVHAHYGWTGLDVLPAVKVARIPLIVSFHGKDASANLRNKHYKNRLPELFDYASFIILCSPHMTENLSLERWLDKVRIIPYGINVNEFVPAARRARETIKILHAGRLVPKKGVPDLIEAFHRLAKELLHVELHIVGDGPEYSLCKDLVDSRNLATRVSFYGALPVDEVRKMMQDCDIFVLNSRTDKGGDMEGLPNALLEAMCCGVAVISTRHAGIPMAVENENTGLLIRERSIDELQGSMKRLALEPVLRTKLGDQARRKIISEFSMEKMEKSLLALFTELSKKKIKA